MHLFVKHQQNKLCEYRYKNTDLKVNVIARTYAYFHELQISGCA